MPGFRVGVLGTVGDPVDATKLKPFYTYTWDIPGLFVDPFMKRVEDVTIFAKDCTLPSFSAGREEVNGAGIIYKYASMVNWDDVRISFYDIPKDGAIFADRIKQWSGSVWTPDSGLGYADNYKKDTNITVFNLDGSRQYTWHLKGSWPQSIRDGELTYTRSEVKVIDIVVVYDWADITSEEFESDLG